ncbi:MAG: hypothetical protein P8H35_00525 [Flavobacteriales bacterium]|nr:hypothetical protein [Flavobacteriales bacterium]
MAGIETSQTFANNDQVTATTLNNIISLSKLNVNAVDGDGSTTGTVHVTSGGVLSVGEIVDGNIGTNQVGLTKLAQIADAKVLGNVSGGTANVSEVATTDISKAGFTPTAYNAEESVTLPNGLIMKMGRTSVSAGTTSAIAFGAAFNAIVSVQATAEKATDITQVSIDNIALDHFDVIHTDGVTHVNWLVIGK